MMKLEKRLKTEPDVRLLWRELKQEAGELWMREIRERLFTFMEKEGWEVAAEDANFRSKDPKKHAPTAQQVFVSARFNRGDWIFGVTILSFEGVRASLYYKDVMTQHWRNSGSNRDTRITKFGTSWKTPHKYYWQKTFTMEEFEKKYRIMDEWIKAAQPVEIVCPWCGFSAYDEYVAEEHRRGCDFLYDPINRGCKTCIHNPDNSNCTLRKTSISSMNPGWYTRQPQNCADYTQRTTT